ncbi:basic amino acid ABC transporter substrate-binding protein [Crenobacter caeni]|uniref:Basic amino acid ABC transporter substrate-binding protein n=1 Tax=Crenobacter caeni TaxID=2705474 RepID=A0A6B2KUC8_9NEIS|nr:basic amino acid ABC transporter substrate-binding protein [Crenobacter caeni]NDV13751.1 basic amino acid ABC transporter substrate-binding protein [Crenobacter caeni]
MKQNRRTLLATMLAGVFVLAGCGQKDEAATPGAASAPQAAAEEKVYVVGSDAAYAPFEYQNEKGEVVGFDVDVLNAVADKGGFKVKVVNTPWEGIFATLDQGDRDIIVSSVTITDERKQSMDFSEPYFEARQLIATGKGGEAIKSFQDLKGKKVAVQTGTTGDEVVQKLLGKTSPDIKRFESLPLAIKELENGGVQAVVGDNGVVANYVTNNPQANLRMVEDTQSFQPEFYGMAVKKGNQELLDKLNKGIQAIKADGTYDKIHAQYFGSK